MVPITILAITCVDTRESENKRTLSREVKPKCTPTEYNNTNITHINEIELIIMHRMVHSIVNTPFTQGLRPLCLPCATTKLSRSPLKAEGRQNGCLGRSRVVHRTFRHRHGRHGRREVLSMFKTVAQRSPRRSVAHRSLKGGRVKAHTSPWSQNGCTVVGHWSPS